VGGSVKDCTSHSVRRSATSWAARCGLKDAEIQRVGRWAIQSTNFRLYMEDGMCIQRKHLGALRATMDPAFKFWTFMTCTVDARG
jgi:hypothetical protein